MSEDIVEALKALEQVPDEILSRISFATPWQIDPDSGTYRDPDGFPEKSSVHKDDVLLKREDLQVQCWDKFHKNPQVNTSVRGLIGRLTGWGFETTSTVWAIQEVIEEIELDARNRLYNFWPKYSGRGLIEGELFLILTVHPDGFVEVDFLDPSLLDPSKGVEGIIFHPNKTVMPLVYFIKTADGQEYAYPSIFLARYPELKAVAQKDKDFTAKSLAWNQTKAAKYKKIGGYRRFVVSWDRSFVTLRNISYLRTIIEWLNHYENLKKYEIDHKKSSGAYVWVVEMEDVRAFRLWLSMTDEQKRKTGIMQRKTPGATLVLPPGMRMTAQNPTLPKISEGDTDIMHQITAGLNEPEDVSTGQSKGTFASVKASRGPMSDRTSDEVAWFHRFLVHDFWASVFFLRSAVSDFPETFTVNQAIGFKNKEAVFKDIKRKPEQLLEVSYPTSEVVDFDARAKGLLGVKHGSLYETLGVCHSEIAHRLGIGNYNKVRLKYATEEKHLPDLMLTADQESFQETMEAEPSRATKATRQAKKAEPKKAEPKKAEPKKAEPKKTSK